MVVSFSLRFFLSLSLVLYSRLWAFSPEKLKLLEAEKVLLNGRLSPLKEAAKFAWHKSFEGGPQRPRMTYWNKTNIVGGLALGSFTVGIGAYVAYESHLSRLATEKSAFATERAASAAEVQAGIKTVDQHRKSFPG